MPKIGPKHLGSLAYLYTILMADSNDPFADFITKVQDHHKAIEEEFEVAQDADDPTKVKEIFRKKLATSLLKLLDDLLFIAHLSKSDPARLNAIKYAFQLYFDGTIGEDDPFSKLLNELTENEAKTT